jgi:hypothetical protein
VKSRNRLIENQYIALNRMNIMKHSPFAIISASIDRLHEHLQVAVREVRDAQQGG